MNIDAFVGINNVVEPARHKPGELTAALNVDLDRTGALLTRRGRTLLRADCAHSIYEAPFGLLAVVESDLVLLAEDGTTAATIYFSLGFTRVWYVDLPDGRIAFSNGLITGVTDGAAALPWGIPPPAAAGDSVVGDVPYFLTYIRQSDRLESGPLYCPPTDMFSPLTGLPQRDGFDIGVYFASDGNVGFYAGSTSTDEFTFTGTADQLVQPSVTDGLLPPPGGRCLAMWQGRVLGAIGGLLWATPPFQFEQHDPRRDFVQIEGDITFVYGAEAGIWVGSTRGLWFLEGSTFGDLAMKSLRSDPVVLGSGAVADLALMDPKDRPDGAQSGAFCISGGEVCLCGDNGNLTVYAAGQYKSAFTEVVATTRERDGVLQYLASSA